MTAMSWPRDSSTPGGNPPDAEPTLHIRLLGGFEMRQGEAPLPPLESARAESLLAFLLLRRHAPQPRQHLAFLLWPDSTESQAQTNLRHVLHNLRRALPAIDHFLEVTPRTLAWRSSASCWLDVAAFLDALDRSEHGAPDNGLSALREAVALYTGDLLEGCYDEWLLREREQLRQRHLAALERLTTLLESRGEYGDAIVYAERLLHHDPLREETYRLLMRLHDRRGDRGRALRVYHACAATLERELGVEPSPLTRAAYEALLPSERENDAPHTGRAGGLPLVGRAQERARLAELWRASERGRTQMVLITGEPGIGKTRLVEEFRSWCVHRGALVAEARSYPAEGELVFGPVIAWLRSAPVTAKLGRLDRFLLTELARLLPELLAERPDLPRPEPLPERDQRQRLFDAIAQAILSTGGPLLLIADDLHWCDQETLHVLHYLLRVQPEARLLVVATARSEAIDHRHPLNELLTALRALDWLTEIPIERLTRAETAVLAERTLGQPLTAQDQDRLFNETEGNPLFIVEALRAGWSSEGPERQWLSPKVQAAIEARLAQLSQPARELVGLAATIGREFSTDVLMAASDAGDDTVVGALDELWRRRIIREQGAEAYDFSHDKIREVAYLDLSPVRRHHFHLRVAQALARLHAHDPGPVSGQIAGHYDRGGNADLAITWYERAAEAAQQLHANGEAIRLLERALRLLHTLPATRERQVRELSVLTALPAALGWVEGWASERLAMAQQRALDLARTLGMEPAPPLLRCVAITSLARRDFETAHRVGAQLQARATYEGDDVLLVESQYVLGIAAFWQGEFAAARKHFESAVAHYRAKHRRTHLLRYGLDPMVVCLSRLGNTLWFLGFPEGAARARDAALVLAGEIGHPFSRGTALAFAAVLALDMRDTAAVRTYVAMLAEEQAKHGMRPNDVAAEHFGGYIDALDGRTDAGISRIRRMLDESRQGDHAPGMRAFTVRVLLEACAVAGDARTGLAAADWVLSLADAHRTWEAETRRLRAEFLAALGAPADEVEAELDRALAVARQQGAKSLELRAATSLLRHRLAHGDSSGAAQARKLLATIVEELPEQADTPDLREAAAFLKQR